MSTPLELRPESNQPLQLVDYRHTATEQKQVRLLADDPNTGRTYEIRLLPAIQSSTDRERLTQQLRLLRLMPPEGVRQVASCDTNHQPPRVTLPSPNMPLCEFVARATAAERWNIAVDIFAIFHRAIRLGLLHGKPRVSSVAVTANSTPEIDFLESFYASEPLPERFQIEDDISGVLEIMRELLGPIADASELSDLVGQRRRAQLKQLLRETEISDQEFVAYDQWCQLLVHEVPPSSTSVPISQADKLLASDNDVSATGEIQIDLPSAQDVAIDDATAEVDLNHQDTSWHEVSGPDLGDTIGRFRLEKLLGQGGMGKVFLATDLATQACVALKILRPSGDVGKALRRFHKEARLLSQLNNPYVTRQVDSGSDGRVHFLAMEYVDGTDLKRWLAAYGKPLEETEALKLLADIARGLIDAHDVGIIHRDIKPENVLLGRKQISDVQAQLESLADYSVKLSDFGIARSLEQSESLAITRQGSLLGTPLFMAPEQFKGDNELSPATDVYSLGITLFTLLAGRPPFVSDDPMKLAAMHCFDIPGDIRKINPLVSSAVYDLLMRMLLKKPTKRPADASQVVREVEGILHGDCRSVEAHPVSPTSSSDVPWQRTMTWELESSPSELWPYVSNTDRVNRAMGLRAVTYRTEHDPVHGLRRFGSFKLAGMRIEWETHPFEWIEGQRMGVLREFNTGPFQWFMSVVELQELPTGKTQLKHILKIQPRNWLGRVVAEIEAGFKAPRALERIYRRIDRSIQSDQASLRLNRFEQTKSVSGTVRRRLEQRMEQMIQLGASLDSATQLTDFLQSASPQELAQIRPLEMAEHFGGNGEQWIETCLIAAHCGLLKLHWEVLCPTCRVSAASANGLKEIEQHTHCEACDADFRSDIANAIELVFHAHPEIRAVDAATYCIGGPMHAPHVLTQLRLEAGERLEVRLDLENGNYLLRGVTNGRAQPLQVRAQVAPTSFDLCLSKLGSTGHSQTLRRGTVLLSFTNDQPRTEVVRLERTVSRQTVVTAAVASAMPRFREYFPEQGFDRQQAITADDLTLLAVRLVNLEAIYEELGDTEAYRLIQTVFQEFEQMVVAAHGAFIKSDGEVFLASFPDCQQAVQAAWKILSKCHESVGSSHAKLAAAIGVHRGSLLMTTQNGRLDYFGSTVRQARALSHAITRGIALTAPVFTDPAVEQCVQANTEATTTASSVELTGFPTCLIKQIDFAGASFNTVSQST